jgi:hypothetical protein
MASTQPMIPLANACYWLKEYMKRKGSAFSGIRNTNQIKWLRREKIREYWGWAKIKVP